MNIQEHVKYWLDSANNDLGAAEQLFLSERYDWCLFIGHLVTEKTLKAFFVYKNDRASFISSAPERLRRVISPK